MTNTPEQPDFLDELAQMELYPTATELRDYDAFSDKLARSSFVANSRNKVIDGVQTAQEAGLNTEESDDEVIDVDAINDAEVTRQLDESEAFSHEFAHSLGVVALLDRDEHQAGLAGTSGVGDEPVSWPHVEQSTPEGTRLDVDLAIMMHEPSPPLATYTPDVTDSVVELAPRKSFLSRFKRQRPNTEFGPKPERRSFRSKLTRIAAVGTAVVALTAGTFLVKSDSSENVTANASPASVAAHPGNIEKLGSLLTVERPQLSAEERVNQEATVLQAQQEAAAIITVASMQAQYGSDAVNNLFANLES